jgi:hypothetical protein
MKHDISSEDVQTDSKKRRHDQPSDVLPISRSSSVDPDLPGYYPPGHHKRVSFLASVPQLIGKYMNDADINKVRDVFNSSCIENCALKSPTLPYEVYGRHRIVETTGSVLKSIPDYSVIFQSSEVDNRMISAEFVSTGTVVYNHSSDYLWNYLKYSKNGGHTVYPVTPDQLTCESRDEYVIPLNDNKVVAYAEHAALHLIMNEEKTFIEKVICIKHSTEFVVLDRT